MDSVQPATRPSLPDYEIPSRIIREFNIARGHVSSYPKGHPLVSGSCERVASLFRELFNYRDELTMGIAKDSLIIDGISFNTISPFALHFARSLFYHRIAVVTFKKGLTVDEIEKFSHILAEKREDIALRGGIERVFQESVLPNLNVKEISYDGIKVIEHTSGKPESVESSTTSLWEMLVKELMQCNLHSSTMPPDQEFLAEVLQNQSSENQFLGMERLATFMQKNAAAQPLSFQEADTFRWILEFVGRLKPATRRHFIASVLGILENDEETAQRILSGIPLEFVRESSKSGNINSNAPSSLLINALESLYECSISDNDDNSRPDINDSVPHQELLSRISVIFRETAEEECVPTDYLQTLKTLLSCREIPGPKEIEILELTRTLSSESVETAISGIILDSIQFAAEEHVEMLTANLLELHRFFLEVGDFRSLEDMYDRLTKSGFESTKAFQTVKDKIIVTFELEDFTGEVLNGPKLWGKAKFHEIGSLIQKVGTPFIEPMLDRLAEEKNITIRRFFLEHLRRMAPLARESVLARLEDKRWYFVRNLLIILKHSMDPGLTGHLRQVAGHPHPKVRQKVTEILLMAGDPEGDRLLLNDLTGDNPAFRLHAIQQANRSSHPDVAAALMGILQRKGFSPETMAEKKASIRTLADLGDPRVIPVLERFLKKWFLFRHAQAMELKKEIIRTLVRYRGKCAVELLKRITKSMNTALSALASEQLSSIKEPE